MKLTKDGDVLVNRPNIILPKESTFIKVQANQINQLYHNLRNSCCIIMHQSYSKHVNKFVYLPAFLARLLVAGFWASSAIVRFTDS